MVQSKRVTEFIELERKVLLLFPYPIAKKFSYIYEWDGGSLDRLNRTLDCFFTAVRFLLLEQVQEYIQQDAFDDDLNAMIRHILIDKKSTFGEWLNLLTQLSKKLSNRPNLFMYEYNQWFQKNHSLINTSAEHIFNILPKLRNECYHPSLVFCPGDYSEKFYEIYPVLCNFFKELSFLSHYFFVVPQQYLALGNGIISISHYYRLQGTFFRFINKDDNKTISISACEKLHSGVSALLMKESEEHQSTCNFLIYPFFVFRYLKQIKDHDLLTFLEWNLRKSKSGLTYQPSKHHIPPYKPLKNDSVESDNSEEYLEENRELSQIIFHDFDMINRKLNAGLRTDVIKNDSLNDLNEWQQKTLMEYARLYVKRNSIEHQIWDCISKHHSGILILKGIPGSGKSSVLSRIVLERGYSYHFITSGKQESRNPVLIAKSLFETLKKKYRINAVVTDETAFIDFSTLLHDISVLLKDAVEPEVIVIDGLDELSDDNSFTLDFIPNRRYENILFLISTRMDIEYRVLKNNYLALIEEELLMPPMEIPEIRSMLDPFLYRIENQFEKIVDVSEGNPLYIASLRSQIIGAQGIDTDKLPTGIEDYYQKNLYSLLKSDGGIKPFLSLLLVCREALDLWQLSSIMKISEYAMDHTIASKIEKFLNTSSGKFEFYHKKFRDWIDANTDEIEKKNAHQMIIDWSMAGKQENGRFNLYAQRHLPAHLLVVGDQERLMELVLHPPDDDFNMCIFKTVIDNIKSVSDSTISETSGGRLIDTMIESKNQDYLEFILMVNSSMNRFGHAQWRRTNLTRLKHYHPDNLRILYTNYTVFYIDKSRKQQKEEVEALYRRFWKEKPESVEMCQLMSSYGFQNADISVMKEAIQIFKNSGIKCQNFDEELRYLKNNLCMLLTRLGRIEEAESLYIEVLRDIDALIEAGNLSISSVSRGNLGLLYFRKFASMPKALNCFYKELVLRIRQGAKASILYLVRLIAGVYIKIGSLDIAREYLEYVKRNKNNTDGISKISLLNDLFMECRFHITSGNVLDFRFALDECSRLITDVSPDSSEGIFYNYLEGKYEFMTGNFNEAECIYRKRIEEMSDPEDEYILVHHFTGLCETLIMRDKTDEARSMLDHTESILNQYREKLLLYDLLKLRSDYCSKIGDPDAAIHWKEKADQEKEQWGIDECIAMPRPKINDF